MFPERWIKYFKQIPNPVWNFLCKAFGLFLFWKFAYLLFLVGPRSLDRPLTNHIGAATAFVMNHFSGLQGFHSEEATVTTIFEGQIQETHVNKVMHGLRKVLHIADGCNGLELFVLYIGFILCIPSKLFRKLYFIAFGLMVIDLTNIFRCSCLAFIKEFYHPYFDISHHLIFKLMVYFSIAMLWFQFANKTEEDAAI